MNKIICGTCKKPFTQKEIDNKCDALYFEKENVWAHNPDCINYCEYTWHMSNKDKYGRTVLNQCKERVFKKRNPNNNNRVYCDFHEKITMVNYNEN